MQKKMMIMLTLALASSSAFSVTGKDSWREIRTSGDLLIQQPTFAKVFGPQGLFNACATEDELKSLTPVKNCLSYREITKINPETGAAYRDYACSEYEIKHVSISRTYTEDACVRHDNTSGECLAYSNVTSVYPTSFQFAVIEAEGISNGEFIFSKTYALPPCE